MTGEGVGHWFFHQFVTEYDVQDGFYFLGQDDVWGLPQSLDWLDRTARKTAAQIEPTNASSDDESDNFDWIISSPMSMSTDEGQ